MTGIRIRPGDAPALASLITAATLENERGGFFDTATGKPGTRSPARRRYDQSHCRAVQVLLSELSERFVGFDLLLECLTEEAGRLAVIELFRPGHQRAVASDLVVFHRLRRRRERGVVGDSLAEPVGDLVAFVEDAIDRFARSCLRFLADRAEYSVEPIDLAVSLPYRIAGKPRFQTGKTAISASAASRRAT